MLQSQPARGQHGQSVTRCENKPTGLLQAPLWPPRQKTFTAFPAAYVCEQDLLCFPSGLFTYPDSTGSTSGQRNIQLGRLRVCSPVSQLADGTKEVLVCAK